MIPRKALDLIILSILEQNPEGLTGYALVNKFKVYFPISNISPGTLYPKLKKLNESGDISENSKIYTITDQGKQRLTENSPKIIHDSIEFLPKLFKTLIKPLPFLQQLDFSEFWNFSDYGFLDDFLSSNEFCSFSNISQSMENLERMKKRLEQEKINLTERFNKQMENLDKQIELIATKTKECENEKRNWTKIKIEEE
ncbi:PadR family transcriptional regulator [Promethearchaeum syntrophicum]|uniref:PadR family transcriptional regulator n=1 Tax=Promethearchaeum syntrophicum TaxID=2594042 RepID=A0A5B9DFE4_9ARCH|nr:PadR family transcriptional regulator [Candidatus Prometheoarchaeum syntrophicum]QEE18008.1 Transcriptional regulator PadR-like family protein [Candidatus Prometheoarchaeum syntrophicum]